MAEALDAAGRPAAPRRATGEERAMGEEMLGFIGLGVMGEPICANLARRSGCRVVGFDLRAEPLGRLAADGVAPAAGPEAVGEAASVVFLSLPGGEELAAVGARLLPAMRAGSVLVDLSTAPVDLTRELAARFAGRGIGYADAPVARTRHAAERGELSTMVGAAGRDLRPHRAALALLRERRPALRRDRRRAGRQAHEQHGAVRDRPGASPRRSRSAAAAASRPRCCSRR